jgi:hypothetical protein
MFFAATLHTHVFVVNKSETLDKFVTILRFAAHVARKFQTSANCGVELVLTHVA